MQTLERCGTVSAASRRLRIVLLASIWLLLLMPACGTADDEEANTATVQVTAGGDPTTTSASAATVPAATSTDTGGDAKSTPSIATPTVAEVSATSTPLVEPTATTSSDGEPTTPPANTPTIEKQSQTIVFDALSDTTMGERLIALTASASSGLAVTFEASGNCAVSETTLTVSGVGECAVAAHQSGNDAWHPAPDVSHSFAILRGTQTVTLDNPGDYTYAENLTIALTASASSGLPVTFVVVDDNACSGVDGGEAVITNQGICEVKAVQDGNDDFFSAESASVVFTINSAPGAFVWDEVLPDRTFPPGESFDVSATIIAGAAVTFFAPSTFEVCDVSDTAYDGNLATATVLIKGEGTCTLEASQSDSQNYFGADSVTKSFEVVSSTSISTPSTP